MREEGHPPCASSSGRWNQQSSIRFFRPVHVNPIWKWLISKQTDAGCQGLCDRDHFINTSAQMWWFFKKVVWLIYEVSLRSRPSRRNVPIFKFKLFSYLHFCRLVEITWTNFNLNSIHVMDKWLNEKRCRVSGFHSRATVYWNVHLKEICGASRSALEFLLLQKSTCGPERVSGRCVPTHWWICK